MFLDEFANTKKNKLFESLIFIFSLFIPGLGYIFITDETMFYELDWIKLILLSVIYTLPLFICIFIAVSKIFRIENKSYQKKEAFDNNALLLTALMTIFTFCLFVLFIRYVPNINFQDDIVIFYGLGFLVSIRIFLEYPIEKWRKKHKKINVTKNI